MMSLAIVAGCFYILAGLAWGIMFSYDFKAYPDDSYEVVPTAFQEIRNRTLAFLFGLFCWPFLAGIYGWIHLADGDNIVGWGMSRMGKNRQESRMPFPIICAICRETRPFNMIGVFRHELEDMPGSTYNVHYCLDNEECTKAAPSYNPFKDGYPKKADTRDGLPKHYSNPESTLTQE